MILIRLMGGLGNQMFQYAAARSLAAEMNTALKIDISLLLDHSGENLVIRDYELGNIFQIKEDFAEPALVKRFNPQPQNLLERIQNKLRMMVNPPNTFIQPSPGYHPEIHSLGQEACLVGQFQSEKYFQKHAPLIRKDFTFKHPLSGITKELALEIESTNSLCINVRRGDYVDHPIYSKNLGFIGMPYYQAALRHMMEFAQIEKAYVFSDDLAWCQEHLKLDIPHMLVGHEHKGSKFSDYLRLMSLCKHFIIPNSTFAWWAAWLGQKDESVVIAPKKWSADGSLNSPDRIPPTWIQI